MANQCANYANFLEDLERAGLTYSVEAVRSNPNEFNLYIWLADTPYHGQMQSHVHMIITRDGDQCTLTRYHITLRDVPGNAVNVNHFYAHLNFHIEVTGASLLVDLRSSNRENRLVRGGLIPEMERFLEGWDYVMEALLGPGGVFASNNMADPLP